MKGVRGICSSQFRFKKRYESQRYEYRQAIENELPDNILEPNIHSLFPRLRSYFQGEVRTKPVVLKIEIDGAIGTTFNTGDFTERM